METETSTWLPITRTARAEYLRGAFSSAAELYDEALTALGRALREETPTPALLMTLVQTQHSRAAALVHIDRLDEAEKAYASAHAFVHALSVAPRLATGIRELAKGLCAIALAEWQGFRAAHADHCRGAGSAAMSVRPTVH